MVRSCMEQLALGSRSPLADGGEGNDFIEERGKKTIKNFIEIFSLLRPSHSEGGGFGAEPKCIGGCESGLGEVRST